MRASWLGMILAGCTAGHAPAEGWRADRGGGIDALDEALSGWGLPAQILLREAVQLGSEAGWDVVRIPAFPEPGEPFRLAIVANSPRPRPVEAVLRGSTDGFVDWVDLPGTAYETPSGHPLWAWGPVRFSQPVTAQFAVRVVETWGEVWLNDDGQDYDVPVSTPQPVTYAGAMARSQAGVPRDASDQLFAGQDLTLRAETYPSGPAVQLELAWEVDGVAQAPVSMRIDQVGVGQFGNDTRWEATLPTAGLQPGSVVSWGVTVDSAGPPLVLDDAGQPFSIEVGPAASVDWFDTGVYSFSQCHWDGTSCTTGWAWRQPLPDPLDATPSNYQAYAAAPYPAVELYVPGVTDRLDHDPAAATLLQVEVVSPFFSGDPAGAWGSWPMTLRERAGNNLRFDWLPRVYQAPGMPPLGVDCPADGDYAYRFRVSTDGGGSWIEIGDTPAPASGQPFTMQWENLSSPPSVGLAPAGGPAFSDTAVGDRELGSMSVTNTSDHRIALTSVGTDDPSHFDVGWTGCPTAACPLQLDPGEAVELLVRFAPTVAGDYAATLSFDRTAVGSCTGTGRTEVALVATGI